MTSSRPRPKPAIRKSMVYVSAFRKTILQEFYQVAFRRKIYRYIEELQTDLDDWFTYYNNDRTHTTLFDGKKAWKDKITTLNN